MDQRSARRPVLALAGVAFVASFVSVTGGAQMEVKLVAVGLASMLVAALLRARGIVSSWPGSFGSGLQTRETRRSSSRSQMPLGRNPKAG